MKSRCEHAAQFKNGEDEIQIARETSRLGLENQAPRPGSYLAWWQLTRIQLKVTNHN